MIIGKSILNGCLLVGGVLVASTSFAASEVATFKSFYHASGSPNWWLAAVFAIVTGGLLFFTGPAAGPIVAGIGGWIGGIMGFHGIAATNAGLALLGGGSIASGGFGIAGGVAVLTAALTFSTDVVFDYGINQAQIAYDKKAFVEASSKMTQLPLPVNHSGPASVKAAMKVLKKVDSKKPLTAPQNQDVLNSAVETMRVQLGNTSKTNDQLREQSLYALLTYLNNDYTTARKSASSAYKLALRSGQRATLPAFVYSVSELYQPTPNVNKAYDYFAYSVTKEQDAHLRPFLFAAFLDRAEYRMGDGGVPQSILDRLYSLSQTYKTDKHKAALQCGMVGRYFKQIKLEQQKIISLSETQSLLIKNSPKTLSEVNTSFKHYTMLLKQTKRAIDDQQVVALAQIKKHRIYKPGWEQKWLKETESNMQLWEKYRHGKGSLSAQIVEFERYQVALTQNLASEVTPLSVTPEENL